MLFVGRYLLSCRPFNWLFFTGLWAGLLRNSPFGIETSFLTVLEEGQAFAVVIRFTSDPALTLGLVTAVRCRLTFFTAIVASLGLQLLVAVGNTVYLTHLLHYVAGDDFDNIVIYFFVWTVLSSRGQGDSFLPTDYFWTTLYIVWALSFLRVFFRFFYIWKFSKPTVAAWRSFAAISNKFIIYTNVVQWVVEVITH